MTVQVLASVMNQSIDKITEQMNLDSEAIIINQCDCFKQEEMEYRGHKVRFFSFPDRGIGKSRNEAIIRADSDICLFSDEDIVYKKGYAQAILAEFERNPKADMILFNIEVEESRRTYHITERTLVQLRKIWGSQLCHQKKQSALFRSDIFPFVWWRSQV